MVTTKRTYTLDDLLAMPDDGNIYELLEGELVVNSAGNSNHAEVVRQIVMLLTDAERADLGRWYTAPYVVAFDWDTERKTATQPDVFFLRRERLLTARPPLIGYQFVRGAPDLLVEVHSPNNTRREMERKHDIYETFGVPFYLLIDPEGRTVEQYTPAGGKYGAAVVLGPGDTPSCPLLPGFTLTAARLFAEMREREAEDQWIEPGGEDDAGDAADGSPPGGPR